MRILSRLKELLYPPRMQVEEKDWNHERCREMYELTSRVRRPIGRFSFCLIAVMIISYIMLLLSRHLGTESDLKDTIDYVLLVVGMSSFFICYITLLAFWLWEMWTEKRVEPDFMTKEWLNRPTTYHSHLSDY